MGDDECAASRKKDCTRGLSGVEMVENNVGDVGRVQMVERNIPGLGNSNKKKKDAG